MGYEVSGETDLSVFGLTAYLCLEYYTQLENQGKL